MPWKTIWHPKLRLALMVSGLAVALSGCHYHPGYFGGGLGYYGGGYHGSISRGFHKKRFGFRGHRGFRGNRLGRGFRGRGYGGWRGRY